MHLELESCVNSSAPSHQSKAGVIFWCATKMECGGSEKLNVHTKEIWLSSKWAINLNLCNVLTVGRWCHKHT